MLKVVICNYGYFEINSYIIIDDETKKCLIVDPGGDCQYYYSKIEERNLSPLAILVTHCHFDHIDAVEALRKKYTIPVYAHKVEAEGMINSTVNLSRNFIGAEVLAHADRFVLHEEIINVDNIFEFKCIMVPGHSSNSICYYFEHENMVFTGDTLFKMSVGRTDLYNGSPSDLVTNIKDKLLVLPEYIEVYPGHGSSTTIIHEKKHNPYL